MFSVLKEKLFHRHNHEEDLQKLQAISEQAKRFEQAVIEAMSASFNDSELPTTDLDSDTAFK